MTEEVNEVRKRCCTSCLHMNNGICKNTCTEKTSAKCGVDIGRKGDADK